MKADKQRWQENKEKIDSLYTVPDEIVDLNVGGTHLLTTSKRTLVSVKDSALAAMFSGRHKLSMHNGRVFIDRDGDAFVALLSFLRSGKVPIFHTQDKEQAFYDELDFWMVPISPLLYDDCVGQAHVFVDLGEASTARVQLFDREWCAETLMLSADNRLLRKNVSQHGIVFCN